MNFKSTTLLIFLMSILFSFDLSGQTVTGLVVDATDRVPIPGVTITVKNTTDGTVTDVDGAFSLSVSPTDVLVFSYIGYTTIEVPVANQTVINVSLNEDSQVLNEVVVTGLGIKKESKKLGYAVTSVNTSELVDNRTTNVVESLVGRVAGLNITPPAAGAN